VNELRYSPEAMCDLEAIWDHIFNELQNPAGAKNTVDRILDKIGKLSEFPEIGTSLTVVTTLENSYRFLVCGNYLAFYRIEEALVSVDRILFGGRDYLRIIFGDPAEYDPE